LCNVTKDPSNPGEGVLGVDLSGEKLDELGDAEAVQGLADLQEFEGALG